MSTKISRGKLRQVIREELTKAVRQRRDIGQFAEGHDFGGEEVVHQGRHPYDWDGQVAITVSPDGAAFTLWETGPIGGDWAMVETFDDLESAKAAVKDLT